MMAALFPGCDHTVPRGAGAIFARTRLKLAVYSHTSSASPVTRYHQDRSSGSLRKLAKKYDGRWKLENTSRRSRSLIPYASSDGLLPQLMVRFVAQLAVRCGCAVR